MDDHIKPTNQLIAELTQLRERVAELETANAALQQTAAESAATLQTPRDSDLRLRHITDNMLDVVGLTDLNGVYQYISPSIKTVAGYAPLEIVGQTLFEHIHPDDVFHLLRISLRALRTGQTGRMTLRYRHADGHYVTLEAVGTPARDNAGRIIGGVMSARDITARTQAETALRDAQQLHADLVNALPQNLYRVDRAGRVTFANRATLASLGVSLADCLGKSAYDFYPPELAAKYRADDQHIFDTGEPFTTIEDHLLPASGEHIYVEVIKVPIRSATGDITGIQGMFWDVTARVRAENALRESELLYQSLVEVSPLSICRKDLAGYFTFANRQFLEASHCSLADVMGRTDFDLHPPELAEKYRRDDRAVMDSGQAQEFIEERAVRGGETIIIHCYKTPVYDGTGKITGVQISFWDITARQRAEQAEHDQRELADSLREVASLLNSSLDFSTILDQMLATIGRVVPHATANVMIIDGVAGVARVVRARGYGQISPDFAERVLSFNLPLSLSNLRRMIDTRQPVIIDDTHTAPDWVVTPETAWTRSYLGAPIVLRDQTLGIFNLDSEQPDFFTPEHARRLMAFAAQAAAAIENARLFEAERNARQLAEALRDTAAALSHSLNPDDVLTEVLKMVERVVPGDGADIMLVDDGHASVVRVRGRCRPDTIGAGRFDINATANLCSMRDTGEPLILDDTRLNPVWQVRPGDEWIASYAGAPIYIHGELLGFLGLYSAEPGFFSARHTERLKAFADQIALAIHNSQLHASIQRHAEELEGRVQQRTRELVAANEQLTQLDQLKDQFISRISHELRTPLTNIKIYLELLETGKAEKRPKYLATLSAQTVRLQELIEDLLEVSQLDMPNLTLNLRPCDLNRVATDLLNDQKSLAQQRGLTLTADLQPDLPPALGDSSLMFQAATRLMSNALAYTPAGGSVTVITRAQSHADSNWITLTVQDTGPGISAKDLPHLFERFYRGEAASDYTVPGTGLGLSISQTIIDKLNGRITVDSEPGDGAAFTIWLPAAK